MKERPILMTPENAQKCHEGIKTQTRRIIKPQPLSISWFEHQKGWCARVREDTGSAEHPAYIMVPCHYGVVGDRLWVREAFTYWECSEDDDKPKRKRVKHVRWEDLSTAKQAELLEHVSHYGEDFIIYKGGGSKRSLSEWGSSHPIQEHCIGRFDKSIPSIHMPRWACRTVLEITDVRVERVQDISESDCFAEGIVKEDRRQSAVTTILRYQRLWESINGKESWALNPWVWVIEFRRVVE